MIDDEQPLYAFNPFSKPLMDEISSQQWCSFLSFPNSSFVISNYSILINRNCLQSSPTAIDFLNAGDRFHPMRPILTDESQSRVGAPLDWSELLTLFYYAGKGHSMHQIGSILNRDARTVSRNYNTFFYLIKFQIHFLFCHSSCSLFSIIIILPLSKFTRNPIA
jgi:hypothetical protein